jgi:TolA-binding protein
MVDVKHRFLPVLLAPGLCLATGMTPSRAAGVAVPPPGVEARASDAEIEALAKRAMASTDPAFQADTLRRLQDHPFKSSLARERELTLFVQGLLEDRQGNLAMAAAALRKLEQTWPRSVYLAEANVILADAALQRRRPQEAEARLRRALAGEIPAEARERGQDLLLWCLAEQGRAAEGLPLLKAVGPPDTLRASERGLVGILEAQCAGGLKEAAATTLQAYRHRFPDGPHARRVDLAWARLQGASGEAQEAAAGFRALIQTAPASAEADEARLALATLLTDGRLPANASASYPSPRSLLDGMQKGNLKDSSTRQALLVKARLAMGERRWPEAIAQLGPLRALHPSPTEAQQASDLRADALRRWARELLDQHRPAPLLPYLDREGVPALTPELRQALAGELARTGLPEAAKALLPLAPAAERPGLLRAALEAVSSTGDPEGTLDLLPGKGESPRQSLARAQAELTLRRWPEARAALARASAGPERIQALVTYLDRPAGPGEAPAARRREAEAWLARAPEQGADREPLAILAADLRVREGDWRRALALYPAEPQPAHRGWVALMRATCQARLGQKQPALATLKEAGDDKAYKAERQALEQRLAM